MRNYPSDDEFKASLNLLREDSSNVQEFRRFNSALGDQTSDLQSTEDTDPSATPRSPEDWDFLIHLLYTCLTEDVLRNFAEDDNIAQGFVRETVRPLIEGWGAAEHRQTPESLGEMWEHLLMFAAKYRHLPRYRGPVEHRIVDGVKFLVAADGGIITGIPKLEENAGPSDATLQMFPDLDATVTDPAISGAIIDWYAETIAQLRDRLADEGRELSTLCVVEKPFSVVGGITLTGALVRELNIPAVVYRLGYWDKAARISGMRPPHGGSAVIVYDTAITGGALAEAVQFLSNEFGIDTAAAVVLYDFGDQAGEALARTGVALISRLNRSQVQRVLAEQELGETVRSERGREVMAMKERLVPVPSEANDERVIDVFDRALWDQTERDLDEANADFRAHGGVPPATELINYEVLERLDRESWEHLDPLLTRENQRFHRERPPLDHE